ncbi:hypothetical protein DFJ74DRAFT_661438 [Hyaloraphidium curvatum]|nr:hypothetical protein DFJ74DRAFT_661438 [Hyaloraphidium curvatum]
MCTAKEMGRRARCTASREGQRASRRSRSCLGSPLPDGQGRFDEGPNALAGMKEKGTLQRTPRVGKFPVPDKHPRGFLIAPGTVGIDGLLSTRRSHQRPPRFCPIQCLEPVRVQPRRGLCRLRVTALGRPTPPAALLTGGAGRPGHRCLTAAGPHTMQRDNWPGIGRCGGRGPENARGLWGTVEVGRRGRWPCGGGHRRRDPTPPGCRCQSSRRRQSDGRGRARSDGSGASRHSRRGVRAR